MTNYDPFREQRELTAALASAHLEPDPSRTDWADHAGQLEELWDRASARSKTATIGGPAGPWADLIGGSAVVLHLAGRRERARQLITSAARIGERTVAATELREATDDLPGYATLVHARWLLAHGQSARASATARTIDGRRSPSIAAAARPIARARLWRAAAIITTVLGIAAVGAYEYVKSDSYAFSSSLADAHELADSNPDAAMERYVELLVQEPGPDEDQITEIVAAVIELACADVPSPVAVGDVAAIERALYRIEALPVFALHPRYLSPFVNKLEGWAAQLGRSDADTTDAQLDVLAMAEPLATDLARPRVATSRQELGRAAAAALVSEWPIEAIRRFVALGPDLRDVEAAGRLLAALGDGPSVWLELAAEVEQWAAYAGDHPETAGDVAPVLARLQAAQDQARSDSRIALLESPTPDAVRAHLREHPGDQEAAAVLAGVQLDQSETEQAIATLEGIGRPGEMVTSAQLLLAYAYRSAERTDDAAALLDRVLNSRFPAFREARRALDRHIAQTEARLWHLAREDDVPAPWAEALRDAGEAEVQQVFGRWFEAEVEKDPQLPILRERYAALSGIVDVATELGALRLAQANTAHGDARQQRLSEAERAFLSIAAEGHGTPSFHIGLGTVYFRLGRTDDAEREFATVLEAEDPITTLSVAHAYRALGDEGKTRELAESVYETAPLDVRTQAASLLALISVGRDERKKWYRRSDDTSRIVKLNLREIEAEEALLAGDTRTADKLFASVARAWNESTSAGNAGANNAALATARRFACSGKLARLEEAEALLERARRLAPDSTITLANQISLFDAHAHLVALDRWLDVSALRPAGTEIGVLSQAIGSSDYDEELRAALDTSPFQRQLAEAAGKLRALAPQAAAGWRELDWALSVQNVERGEALLTQRERVELPLDEARRVAEAADAGAYDGETVREATAALARYAGIRARAAGRRAAATIAASWVLEAEAHVSLAVIRRDPEHLEHALAAYAEAERRWPALRTCDARARAALLHAGLDATGDNEEANAVLAEQDSSTGVALALLEHAAVGEALSAHPSYAKALEVWRTCDEDDLGVSAWAMAKHARDVPLRDRARAQLDRPIARLAKRYAELVDVQGFAKRVQTQLAAD